MEEIKDSVKNKVISQWVREYGDELYSWAFHKTSEEAVAQDIVQETFISAFQHFDSYKKTSSPKTWLFSILKNKIVDYYRYKARNLTPQSLAHSIDETSQWFDDDNRWKKEHQPEPWDTSETLLDNSEFEDTLNNCMGKLPSPWLACLQLKYLSEKDSTDICQQLNITASNLWQILHRAKMHLRNCLERNWFKA